MSSVDYRISQYRNNVYLNLNKRSEELLDIQTNEPIEALILLIQIQTIREAIKILNETSTKVTY
jgi:hypothetical protein